MAVLLLGRPWLGDWARGRQACVPRVMAIEQAVGRAGLKLVLLTRLYPAVPSSLLNLAHGPSEVSLGDDVIGLITILPGTMLFCSLGALAGDGARFGEELSGDADLGTWSPPIIGLVATVASAWLVGRAAQRALKGVGPDESGGLRLRCRLGWPGPGSFHV